MCAQQRNNSAGFAGNDIHCDLFLLGRTKKLEILWELAANLLDDIKLADYNIHNTCKKGVVFHGY